MCVSFYLPVSISAALEQCCIVCAEGFTVFKSDKKVTLWTEQIVELWNCLTVSRLYCRRAELPLSGFSWDSTTVSVCSLWWGTLCFWAVHSACSSPWAVWTVQIPCCSWGIQCHVRWGGSQWLRCSRAAVTLLSAWLTGESIQLTCAWIAACSKKSDRIKHTFTRARQCH